MHLKTKLILRRNRNTYICVYKQCERATVQNKLNYLCFFKLHSRLFAIISNLYPESSNQSQKWLRIIYHRPFHRRENSGRNKGRRRRLTAPGAAGRGSRRRCGFLNAAGEGIKALLNFTPRCLPFGHPPQLEK